MAARRGRKPSNTATEMAQAIQLGTFEGREIVGVTIAITNTGDGLSQAMKVEPVVLHHGDRVRIIIDGVVDDVQFPPVKMKGGERDYGRVNRLQKIVAEMATFVTDDVGAEIMEAHRAKLDRLAGQEQIPAVADAGFGDDELDKTGTPDARPDDWGGE